MDLKEFNDRGRMLEAASLEASNSGVKALLFLNGGACIAMLGFLASVFPHAEAFDDARAAFFSAAISCLVYFASAAGLSIVASLASYLANQCYASAHIRPREEYDRHWKAGTIWTRVGIGSVLLSLLLFAGGVLTLWLATGA